MTSSSSRKVKSRLNNNDVYMESKYGYLNVSKQSCAFFTIQFDQLALAKSCDWNKLHLYVPMFTLCVDMHVYECIPVEVCMYACTHVCTRIYTYFTCLHVCLH